MKKQIISSILSFAAIFAGNVASANIITINRLLTVASLNDTSALAVGNVFTPSVAIQVGDIVDLTLNFLPGQAVHITSTGGNQVFAPAILQDDSLSSLNGSIFSIDNASLELIGLRGTFPSVVTTPTQSSGYSIIGATFGTNYINAGQSFSFTGIHTTFQVTALNENLRYYNNAFLYVAGDGVAVTTAVPEPETYVMLAAGLGLLAFVKRRKAAAAA